VTINTTAPKVVKEYFGMSREDAGFASSIYFLFRFTGCLIGAFAFPLLIGKATDRMSTQAGGLIILGIAVLYLFLLSSK
jgi:hypothetical protein